MPTSSIHSVSALCASPSHLSSSLAPCISARTRLQGRADRDAVPQRKPGREPLGVVRPGHCSRRELGVAVHVEGRVRQGAATQRFCGAARARKRRAALLSAAQDGLAVDIASVALALVRRGAARAPQPRLCRCGWPRGASSAVACNRRRVLLPRPACVSLTGPSRARCARSRVGRVR